MLNHILLQQHG